MKRADEELDLTVDTLIELDEPEAMLRTLQRAAAMKKGPRWARLAQVLAYAEDKLADLNAKPAGPDFRPKVTVTSDHDPKERVNDPTLPSRIEGEAKAE